MKDYIKTSDTAYAAYLMVHDYTFLGCVNHGEVSKSGQPRYDFYITHSDEKVRDNILEEANKLRDLFQSSTDNPYNRYYRYIHKLKKATRNPLTPEEFGKGE